MNNKYDYLIVGSGISGATIARLLTDSGKKVLIVDDVFTTGSTVNAMIDLIKPKNPKKIKILVMSKTRDIDSHNVK